MSADIANGFELLRYAIQRHWHVRGRNRVPAGLEHRIGGLEKSDVTGHVSYDAENHQKMVEIRAEKVVRVSPTILHLLKSLAQQEGEILMLGWGGTYGAIRTDSGELCCRRGPDSDTSISVTLTRSQTT